MSSREREAVVMFSRLTIAHNMKALTGTLGFRIF
jgi:hypothetical protein